MEASSLLPPPRPLDITACLVTRGDVDMSEILASIPYPTVVWNNAERQNLRAYGRYMAAREVQCDAVFFQDDDCVLTPRAFTLLEQCYRLSLPGTAVLHIGPDRDVPWVGWGALVPKGLWLKPHRKYLGRWAFDADFLDFCDVAFTLQVPVRRCFDGYRDMPWAEAASRTCNQPGYYAERRPRMLSRIKELADEAGTGVAA